MKRRSDHGASAVLTQQVGQPQPQLAGGADAERDHEDLLRPRQVGVEQVRDPVDEGSRFPGPRACDQEQRPLTMRHGLRLLGRQRHKQGGSGGRRGDADNGMRQSITSLW